MKHAIKAVIVAALMAVSWLSLLNAQNDSQDHVKFNSNLGMPISVPLHPSSKFADVRVGVVYGAGYNFTGHTTLQDTGAGGKSSLFSLTENYRFEYRGEGFGPYFTGGGGWYYRASAPWVGSRDRFHG
jgi:hypothetical protein